jgi:hypothetical protein
VALKEEAEEQMSEQEELEQERLLEKMEVVEEED